MGIAERKNAIGDYREFRDEPTQENKVDYR